MHVVSCVRRLRIWQAFFLTLLVIGSAVPVAGQGSASAVVTGVIKDAQGGVLPGVTATLKNAESGVTRTAVTDGEGRYRLQGLQPGRYDLVAELPGFARVEVKDVTLTIGLEVQRDVTMNVEGVSEALTVTGQAPVVETTTTEVAAVVTQAQIDSLPISNRQTTALSLLLPGTSMDTATDTSRTQPAVGAGGGTNTSNVYYIDGGMNMIYNSGQQFVEVPQSGVREFKVNVSGSSAQYGAVGGVILTATKTGTNRFSGELFEQFRDKSLNAMDKLQKERHDQLGAPKPDFRRNSYGGAFGGPIIQDRMHFFGSIERSLEETTATVNTGVPELYSAIEGEFPQEYERRWFMGRVDMQLTQNQNAFVRYLYDLERTVCQSCGGNNSGRTGTDTYSPRDSLLVGHTWVITPRVLNEVRAQLPPSHLDNKEAPPGVEKWDGERGVFPPERFAVGYTPVFNFPSVTWGSNGWSNNWTSRWDVYNDTTINLNEHNIKFGVAYLNFRSDEEQNRNLGNWTFASDQFFDGSAEAIANLTNPTQYTESFPALPRFLKANWLHAYINHEWRVRPNLTLEFGLRYENQIQSFNQHLDLTPVPRLRELIDPTTRGDNNNFGPRASFAWDVKGNGRSVVRFASGIFYQAVFAGALRAEMTALRQTSIVIARPPYPDPYGGRTPESFASTAPPNVSVTDDNIEAPIAKTFTLGYSQQLGPSLAIHVDGVYTDVDKMNQTANINTPDPVTGQRPLPTWGRIVQYRAFGKHEYRALFLRLDKRFADRYQYQFSYTLSKQDNEGSSGLITDFYNPGLDFGPGNADRRHALISSGSIRLPYDVNLGAIWSLRSSRAFSARAGIDLNNDGAAIGSGDYVPGTTRNMGNRDNEAMLAAVNAWRAQNGRTPIPLSQIDSNEVNRFDVRASKVFAIGGTRRLEVIGQIFNLFGSDTLGAVGQGWTENALSASFGRQLTVLPRQQGEIAIRFTF